MIPSATQTLAEILAGGISLLSTEQIDFSHPSVAQEVNPRLNLYCYNIRENAYKQPSCCQHSIKQRVSTLAPPRWFDLLFLVSAWDYTSLGEQRLLSEALILLLHHHSLREEMLPPALRGHGELSMTVSAVHPIDAAALWSALSVPLRPALYVTLTIPFNLRSDILNPNNGEMWLKNN
ncbi:Pvc16 family protein [Nodularia sp. UHCC 0506]|uniref:Pvc16 family protein n=1 Tax=Nodularia sp. UHCC 0506 TaxID=3110243 RepID=UPI002B21E58D|nr:Pvc16 family protein [Nodularia sp. UHCC 0506]MEA5516976.1 Pvc16 family protein [Nodularia sp. UHCC 0506]